MRVPVLVPTLAAGLVLALGGCGSDDEPAGSTTSASGGAAATTTTGPDGGATSTTGTVPATSTSGDDTGGQAGPNIVGTGYRTTAPAGWSDVSDRLSGSAIRIDRGYAGPARDGFAPNVVIIRETPPAIRGRSIGDIEEQLRTQAADALNVPAPDVEDRFRLDGDDAIRWTLRRQQGGRALIQRQIAVVHDDALYTMTFSTQSGDDASGEQDLKTVLDGWRWE